MAITLEVSSAADVPSYVGVTGGEIIYANDGQTLLLIKNPVASGPTAIKIRHVEQAICDFGHVSDAPFSSGLFYGDHFVPGSGTSYIWAARNTVKWNDSSGMAHITWQVSIGEISSLGLEIAAVTYIET